VFVTIAFIVGVHLRHYQETQRILFSDILKKFSDRAIQQLEQTPAATAPEPEPEKDKPGVKKMRMPPLQAPPGANN
jgi:hypothetical protein